jgi:hypothetical protein
VEIEKNEDGTIGINVKKIQIFLGIIFLIFIQFIQPLIGAVIDKKSAENTIDNHEIRIEVLENEVRSVYQVVLGMEINLKLFMKSQGHEYIDNSTKK